MRDQIRWAATVVLGTAVTVGAAPEARPTAADANKDLIAANVEYAVEATRFDGPVLPEDVARKLKLLKRSLSLPAPRGDKLQTELVAS